MTRLVLAVAAALWLAACAVAVSGCGSIAALELEGGAGGAGGGGGGAEPPPEGGQVGGKGGEDQGVGGAAGAVGGASGGAGAAQDAGLDACAPSSTTGCLDAQACSLSLGDAWIKCAACPGGGAHASCGTRWCCVDAPPSPSGLPWCAAQVGCALN